MKTIIYYFSGTGNSLIVARDLANNIPDTKLVRVGTNSHTVNEKTNIGLIFPVYSFGVPAIMKKFIEKLNLPNDTYIFAVATCGGSLGYTFKVVEKALAKNNLRLSSAFSVIMPDNFIPFFTVPPKTEQESMFEKEKIAVKTITKCVIQNIKTPIPKTLGPLGAFITSCIYPIALKYFPKADKKFWSNEKCNGCSVCAKICPVNNIEIKDNKPAWQHHCELCLGCLHWCPQSAIQYGKVSPKRGRYHHPELTLKDVVGE